MRDEPLFISWSEAQDQFVINSLEELLEANQANFSGGLASGFAPIAIARTRLEAEEIVDSYEKGLAVSGTEAE